VNLQQFRFLREAARHKFSLTEAARALHTSQPGISKAIIDLEEELGVPILARHGKRVKGLTAPGQVVLEAAERIMLDVDNLKKLARDYAGSPEGTLRIATTHTQARYVLPDVVRTFAQKFPQVRLKLLQANPPQIVSMLLHGQADLGVATESLHDAAGLLSIPVYDWQHVAIVKPEHPLAKLVTTPGKLTLKDLARNPLITYEHLFAGRAKIDEAFAAAGIEPSIVLEAIDADVIKTYVQIGMGVGIVAGVAVDSQRDGLVGLPCGHLFGRNVTRLAVKEGAYLRGFVYSIPSARARAAASACTWRIVGTGIPALPASSITLPTIASSSSRRRCSRSCSIEIFAAPSWRAMSIRWSGVIGTRTP